MLKLILPIRYLLRRRISWLAVAAVGLCVFIVVVVMTVMSGLVGDFKEKNHQFVGDCIISTESLVGFAYYDEFLAEIDKADFVHAASPIAKGFGLLTRSGVSWNIGVEIMGIDPAMHNRVTNFGQTLHYRKDKPDTVFDTDTHSGLIGCVAGIEQPFLMMHRDQSGQYDHDLLPPRMELIISSFPLTAKGMLAGAGTSPVNTKKFRLNDNSLSGIVRVDSRTVYMPLDYAQKLCGMSGKQPRVSAIYIKFTDGIRLNTGCQKVRQLWADFLTMHKDAKYANLLTNVRVQSWISHRRSIIAPMEKEQTMLILLFMLVGVITVFIIFVVFYMIISHKSKDIGILKSIGVPPAHIVALFIIFAAIIGIIGAAAGTAAGCGFLAKINDMEDWLFDNFGWQLWDRSVYAIGEIPNNIDFSVLAVIIISAVAASMLGAFLPSMRGARRQPVETLQVNQL